jgi:hypothetical protein
MKTLSYALFASAASVGAIAISASSASAITLVQTQTFNFVSQPTVWSDSANVARYAPGGLVRVEVQLSGSATSSLEARATTTAQAFIFNPSRVGANIFTSSAVIPSLNVDILPQGTITPTPVVIAGNTTRTLSNLTGTDTDLQVFTTSLSDFEGTTPFTIDLFAIGFSTLTTGGGNLSTTQSTVADATLIVRYFIADTPPPVRTPEPVTLLGILAVAGAGALARRKG